MSGRDSDRLTPVVEYANGAGPAQPHHAYGLGDGGAGLDEGAVDGGRLDGGDRGEAARIASQQAMTSRLLSSLTPQPSWSTTIT
jgi:hypothetical protein